MYIVLEYYLLENYIINLFILLITRSITKTNINIYRVLLGALISTIYSLVLFYPSLLFLANFFMKIIISALIIKITFNGRDLITFIHQLFGFYIVSFIFAGLVAGLSWGGTYNKLILGEKEFLSNIFEFKYLIIGIFLGGIIIYKVFNHNFKLIVRNKYIFDVEIVLKGGSVSLKALLDTGNSLVEPMSKKPVFIVEYDTVKPLLSKNLQGIYDRRADNIYEILNDKWEFLNHDIKLSIIPFQSLGSSGEILLGFRPDYIKIFENNSELIRNNLLIGIYNGELIKDRAYSGLLANELMIGGNNIEEARI